MRKKLSALTLAGLIALGTAPAALASSHEPEPGTTGEQEEGGDDIPWGLLGLLGLGGLAGLQKRDRDHDRDHDRDNRSNTPRP